MVADLSGEWAVVGAGPAGIATVGSLIDAGVDERHIIWIDPQFEVGDFGTSWQHVLSNTPASSFVKFYRDVKAFEFGIDGRTHFVENAPQDYPVFLGTAADPLREITARLRSRVAALVDRAVQITKAENGWRLTLASGQTTTASRVVLALGAVPKRLNIAGLKEIPLTIALHPKALNECIAPVDRVAVFGDAQSARSVLKNLARTQVSRVFHFYHSRRSVERHMDPEDYEFATSLPAQPAHMIDTIPSCTKVIYGIGFERRSIQIDGLPSDFGYDSRTGIIAPGLFGLGIAFPEVRAHEMGHAVHRVAALWPTMRRLQKCLPIWLGTAKTMSGNETSTYGDYTEGEPVF